MALDIGKIFISTFGSNAVKGSAQPSVGQVQTPKAYKHSAYASIPYEKNPVVKSNVPLQYLNYNLPGQILDRLA